MNFETKAMVAELRRFGVTFQTARNTSYPGSSAIDSRSYRHEGYAQSIHVRRGIEKVFGWIKQWSDLRQFKPRGTGKVTALSRLHVIAYNLIRLGNPLKLAFAVAYQVVAQRCAQAAVIRELQRS
jgi:hypothetical protein